MSTRYVWSKWSTVPSYDTGSIVRNQWIVNFGYTPYYCKITDSNTLGLNSNGLIFFNDYSKNEIYESRSVTIPEGTFLVSSTVAINRLKQLANPSDNDNNSNVLFLAASGGAKVITGNGYVHNDYYVIPLYFDNVKQVYNFSPSGARGEDNYGNVSSASSGAYPSNSYSGNYWYVSSGSDTIDPSAVTYDESTLIAGQTVTVTISPSTGNTYGGTITYQVEVNVDETGWEVVMQTTSTSVNLDVPADAVSWRVRVLASDDMGFTSTDYVYGNNATEVPSTVIYPSVFAVMPEDKNLGFIGNSKILTYLVTTDDDADYSIVATLNEIQVYSATESSGAKTLTLSDDIWEELSSDELHTLVLTVTQGENTIVRTYKFKKFVYDYTYLAGLLNGTARAIRVKRGINKQITAVNFPKEILKISQIKEEITKSYIDVSIPYVSGGTIVATYANGDIYGADLDSSGVTRVTVDHKGFYTLRAYAGNSPSSSASVTIENDGDTVSTALQWIKLTVTVESGATVTAVCGEYSVSGTSDGTVDLYLPATGTYAVTASKSSYSFTVSDTVQVTGYNNYTLSMEFINPDFGANSWATIQAVVQAGKAASYWSVGDMKAVTLNGDVG